MGTATWPPMGLSQGRGHPERWLWRAAHSKLSRRGRGTRYWPLAPPVGSDHQVTELDAVQPLLIVSSAASRVID
jgi:hypothetical protein